MLFIKKTGKRKAPNIYTRYPGIYIYMDKKHKLLWGWEGAQQRQQWHLIPLPTRAGRRWQMVWQGPRLGCIAETGRFVAMETPWVRFSCLLAFVPCFLLFFFRFCFFNIFFPHAGMFIFFVSLRVCSSHQLLSASTYFIVRVLSACVTCTLPHLGIILFFYSFSIFFRSSYFSGGVFFCCALVPGTLALDLPTLILQRLVFSVSLSVTT